MLWTFPGTICMSSYLHFILSTNVRSMARGDVWVVPSASRTLRISREVAASSVSALCIGLLVRLCAYLSHIPQEGVVWISHYGGGRSFHSVHSIQYGSYARERYLEQHHTWLHNRSFPTLHDHVVVWHLYIRSISVSVL
jgi:hypothetical protein